MEMEVGFLCLPPEVIVEIASYLSAKDILACSATCSFLRQALNDDLVWKKKCSYKVPDYFKWGECEIEPDFQWEKCEPSSLPLSKVCTWRRYFMMEAHLWRNWKFGDFKTVEFEFGPKDIVFTGTQVSFYDDDYLFLHSWHPTELNMLDEIWCVQKTPFLHSSLKLSMDQYVGEGLYSECKTFIVNNKLVVSFYTLVFIYDIATSSSSQTPISHAFLFDGGDFQRHSFNDIDVFTKIQIVLCGDYFVGAKKVTSSQDPNNAEIILYVWSIETGVKLAEECLVSSNIVIDNFSLLKAENEKDVILKVRVKKDRYMYHYYGYNLSNLLPSQFKVKVNYCDFEIFYEDSVIGAGLQKMYLYSYKTSKKLGLMNCNQEILKKTIKVVGGYLLFGTFENIIYVLDPSSLALINKVKVDHTVYSLQAICDRFIIINSNNSEVWKIGKTCKKLFKLPNDTSFTAVNRFGTKLAVTRGNKIIVLNFW